MALPGLVWIENKLDPAQVSPKWSGEPDINAIRTTVAKVLSAYDPESLDITFLAEGIFNKVYRVRDPSRDEEYVMRISLPVQLFYKTRAKVTILEYLAQHTNLPLPRVLACDASTDNLIGLEWILMTLLPGVQLSTIYAGLSMSQKRYIVRQMVSYSAEVFQRQFTSIGGLQKDETNQYEIGRMVTIPFWWYRRVNDAGDKGPFASYRDCLKAQLQLMIREAQQCYDERALGPIENDDSKAAVEFTNVLVTLHHLTLKLDEILRNTPTPTVDAFGRTLTAITHTDLAIQNLLIDPVSCRITGIIDWEDVSAQPLAIFCQLPHFILPDSMGSGTALKLNPGDNDRTTLELENSELRDYYLQEMQQVCPNWVEEYHKGVEIRDIASVINSADNLSNQEDIRHWLSLQTGGGNKKSIEEIRNERIKQSGHNNLYEGYKYPTDKAEYKHVDEQEVEAWTPAMMPYLIGSPNHIQNLTSPQTLATTPLDEDEWNEDYEHSFPLLSRLSPGISMFARRYVERDTDASSEDFLQSHFSLE